jgi:hypothetical protein
MSERELVVWCYRLVGGGWRSPDRPPRLPEPLYTMSIQARLVLMLPGETLSFPLGPAARGLALVKSRFRGDTCKSLGVWLVGETK